MLVALAPVAIASATAQEANKAKEGAAPPLEVPPAIVSPETVAALEKRVKSLEQQVIDLRTMIGTFASMGRGAASSVANNRGSEAAQFGTQNGGRASRPGSSDLPWGGGERQSAAPRQQSLNEGKSDGGNFEGRQSSLTLPPQRPDVREDGVVSDQFAARGPGSRAARTK